MGLWNVRIYEALGPQLVEAEGHNQPLQFRKVGSLGLDVLENMLDVRWEQGSALLECVPRNLCPIVFEKLNRLRKPRSADKGTKTSWSHLLHKRFLQEDKCKRLHRLHGFVHKRCAAKEGNATNHVGKQCQAHLGLVGA